MPEPVTTSLLSYTMACGGAGLLAAILTTAPGNSELYSAAFSAIVFSALTLITWRTQKQHHATLISGMFLLTLTCSVTLPGLLAPLLSRWANCVGWQLDTLSWDYYAFSATVFGIVGPICLLGIRSRAPRYVSKFLDDRDPDPE